MRYKEIRENEEGSEGRDFEHEKRELDLYIMNDSELYRQRFMPILLNLARKLKRGVYDHELAPKLWQYLGDAGAKQYILEFGGTVRDQFPKEARMALAQDIADEQYEMLQAGEYSEFTGYQGDPQKQEA